MMLRYAIRLFRSGCWLMLDYFAIVSAKRRTGANRPSVAILCMHGMGDLLLSLKAIDVLAKHYKTRGFSIYLYVEENAFQMAQAIEGIDEYVPFCKTSLLRNPLYRWRSIQHIAGAGHTVALQPAYNRLFLIEDAFMRAIGGNERIGSSGTKMFISNFERFIGDSWYSRLTACAPETMHEIDRYKEFLLALGFHASSGWPHLPDALSFSATTQEIVLISINASHPLKSWPVERFEKLSHFIVRKTGKRIVFVGASGSIKPRASFHRWNDAYFQDEVGNTDLSSLIKWIGQADIVVTNDSALMHFATLMQRKVIVIAGGGIPGRYHPYPLQQGKTQPVIIEERMPCYGCGWRCRYMKSYDSAAPCITHIPTTRVTRAVLSELAADADNARRNH